jgi:catechol 2,3-dioxygenase-like lactoylglutathione lyase family enzyme
MKTHLNLGVTDLDRSIAFYSTLLSAEPVKTHGDYALFITEDPGMELALDLRTSVLPTTDAHFGICVESAHDVERAIERLEVAGLASSIEHEQPCCYANQTKVWTADPDGRRWEVYTVHKELQPSDATVACCA